MPLEPLYSLRLPKTASTRAPMTDPSQPDSSDLASQAAADWFARVRSGGMTPAQQAEFEAWREADPTHAAAYAEMEAVWQATAQFDAERLRRVLPSRRPLNIARRRLAFGLGLSAAAIAGVTWNLWPSDPILQEQVITTRAGERRQVLLADGTMLEINTATRARVRFYADRRMVDMDSGEIMFSVTPDAQRPFLIDAGQTHVRVTGTRFNVRRDGDATSVAVESGSVAVTTGSWWRRQAVNLTAGQGVRKPAGQTLSDIESVDVQALTAWRQGKIVVANAPLAEVTSEMNRYLAQPILLADARLGRLRIAGVFSVDDPSAFLNALPSMVPVEVLRGSDGGIVIRAR